MPTPEQYDAAFRLPLRAALWYELSGEAIQRSLSEFDLKQMMTFLDLLGATSIRTKPYDNLARTLAVMSEHLRSEPVDVDLVSGAGVNAALSRGGRGVTSQGRQQDRAVLLEPGPHGRHPGALPDEHQRHLGRRLLQYHPGDPIRAPVPARADRLVPHPARPPRQRHIARPDHLPVLDRAGPALGEEPRRRPDQRLAAEWQRIAPILREAGIPGVDADGTIHKEAFLDPRFSEALRATLPEYREAYKATLEFGTKLTGNGRRALENYHWAIELGDDVSRREYLGVITSTMWASVRGANNPFTLLFRAITGRKPSRMEAPTRDEPFAISGSFEGEISPNVRIPLRGATEDQVEVFVPVVGRHLWQEAQPASSIRSLEPGEALAEGDTAGHSVYFKIGRALTDQEPTALARALPEGHEIATHKDPGGHVVDVNPRFTDGPPVGISKADLDAAIRAALPELSNDALIMPHGHRSVYKPDSAYDEIIRNFEEELARHAESDTGGDRGDKPDYRRRLDDLARAKAGLDEVAAAVDAGFRAFNERTEARAARGGRAGGVEPDAEVRPDAAGPGEPPPARGPPDEEPGGEGGPGGPQVLYQSAAEGGAAVSIRR